MVKVSVIIPMYNAEKYLKLCLDSVVNQSLNDIEVIAINDGSIDDTLKIAQSYCCKIPNFQILNSKNYGAGHARNMGLDVAKGEYIKFLDADDELSNEKTLELMYETASFYGSDLLIGKYYTHIGKVNLSGFYNTLGRETSGIVNLEQNRMYPFQEMPGIGDKLFRREHIGSIRFPETKWEDLAFTPVLMADAQNLYFLDETVYHYRMNLNNTSLRGCLFSHNIFEFFDVYNILKQNFVTRGIKEQFEQELLGFLSMHGHFDASYVPMWLNMGMCDKITFLKYFITKMEYYYPDFRQDKIANEYYRTHSLFKKLFQIADSMASNSKMEVDHLDQEIEQFVKKMKLN